MHPSFPPGSTLARLAALFEPEHRNVSSLLRRQAASLPDRPFVTINGRTYSCADIALRAGRTADLLRNAGVGPGDRVATICGNRVEFLDLFFACAWLNAVAVPINRSSRGPQLHHILRNSAARLLVIEMEVADTLQYVERDGLALTDVWLLPSQDVSASGQFGDWNCRPMPASGSYIDPAPCSPADMAAIIYTSGTTGPSKGACCPHEQFFWWGVHAIDGLEIAADDVLLTTLPLFHVNALGSVFHALLSAAHLVVLDRFSASGFVSSLHDHNATLTYLLGAMAPILLSIPRTDRDRSHRVRRALAPGIPISFRAEFEERFGIGLIEGYGSTETNFIIGDKLADQKPGSMGRVRPSFSARVVDAEDHAVPPGVPGELVVRSDIPDAFATGYFMMPEATAESRRGSWFHTGDRVYCDAEGRFYFMDRLKDAIRRRGENISAYEVEQVLLSHPEVANAAVYPVTSELAEDEVMAAIVLKDGASVTPETLMSFCEPRMSYFSVPRYVLFADSLPMTDNGKVQKFKLRERGVTAATWDREAAGYILTRPTRNRR